MSLEFDFGKPQASGSFVGTYIPSENDGSPTVELEISFVFDYEDGIFEANIHNLSDPSERPRTTVGRLSDSSCLATAVRAVNDWTDRNKDKVCAATGLVAALSMVILDLIPGV